MRTISLHRTSHFEPQFYNDYSRFKHGSKSQARIFGKQAAESFEYIWNNRKLVFYSAPYNNIPTASHAFMNYLLAFSSRKFMEQNISVRQGKVNRAYSYDNDYGNMSAEEREKAISCDLFSMDKSLIEPDDILVFIDDIRITGSHEKRMLELIDREGIKNECVFMYLAVYQGDRPEIEHQLNHTSINSLKDVNDIIRNEEFIFNTRVVKFILKADIEHFVSFITYQSDTFRETLFSLSILNEYHTNQKYKTNFNILKDLL